MPLHLHLRPKPIVIWTSVRFSSNAQLKCSAAQRARLAQQGAFLTLTQQLRSVLREAALHAPKLPRPRLIPTGSWTNVGFSSNVQLKWSTAEQKAQEVQPS